MENLKNNKWYGLSLRIIALFVTAMVVSFSPELLRDFFGDKLVLPDEYGYKWGKGFIDQDWDWGYRHYLYFLMCVALFIVQAARLISWIQKYSKEFNYKGF